MHPIDNYAYVGVGVIVVLLLALVIYEAIVAVRRRRSQ